MAFLALVFLLSLLAALAGLAVPGWSGLELIFAPMAVASLLLLVDRVIRLRRKARAMPPNMVVIDGSNVMHWKEGTAQIETVRNVVQRLASQGYTPGVVFDANAGYKIAGTYHHDTAMGKLLGLPTDRVIVVDKGTPADPVLLAAARDLGARIVTNDRFRDWAEAHPEIGRPGYLIRGGYRRGELWLDTD